jgi:two-component system, LytTR family, sensor kinase
VRGTVWPGVRRRWLVAACCFTFAAVLFTSQVWVDYAYAGRRLSWSLAFMVALADWEVWTLLAPAVLLLAARVPLLRGRLAVSLAVHIPAGLAVTAIKLALAEIFTRAVIGPGRMPFSLLKIYLSVLTYWAMVGAVQYAEQHRLARERELRSARLQTELARAQVEALKMQIHPHFLFNTLNAIAGLMREDVESADTMLAQLSELLRGTLQTEGLQEVPLAEELRLLRAYLAIQQTRFGDRLRIDIDVAVGCDQNLVPTLILQPIVENAIRHGFSVTPGPGTVTIQVSAERERLRIDVTDEGPGPPQPLREGYGLRNTRSRLRALYGDAADFSVAPVEPRGARARLELPLQLTASS